jgi:hypothetical protein
VLKNYPYTLYQNVAVTDILKRVYFSDSFKRSNLVEQYRIRDDDIPESISYLLYKNPDYNWLILNLNSIKNRIDEWPLQEKILKKKIREQFNSSSVYLNYQKINNEVFSKIKYIQWAGSSLFVEIEKYNIQFFELITKNPLDSEQITTGNLTLLDSAKNNLITLSEQENFKKNYRVVFDNQFSIHHFQDKPGEYLNPYLIESGNLFENVFLGFVNGERENLVITNFQQKLEENDNKRDIVLIRPEVVPDIVSKLRSILTGISKEINVLQIDENLKISIIE